MPQVIDKFRIPVDRTIGPGAIFGQLRIGVVVVISVNQVPFYAEGYRERHHVLFLILIEGRGRYLVIQRAQVLGIEVVRHIGHGIADAITVLVPDSRGIRCAAIPIAIGKQHSVVLLTFGDDRIGVGRVIIIVIPPHTFQTATQRSAVTLPLKIIHFLQQGGIVCRVVLDQHIGNLDENQVITIDLAEAETKIIVGIHH